MWIVKVSVVPAIAGALGAGTEARQVAPAVPSNNICDWCVEECSPRNSKYTVQELPAPRPLLEDPSLKNKDRPQEQEGNNI